MKMFPLSEPEAGARAREVDHTYEQAQAIAAWFKVLGDVTRIRIIAALDGQEYCVQELEARLDMSQSAVSHQLRTLKQARMVRVRRDGKNRYYTLDDDHVSLIFRIAAEHLDERTER